MMFLQGSICSIYFSTDYMSRIELFVGFESGAVGGFRIFYDSIKDNLSFKQVLAT